MLIDKNEHEAYVIALRKEIENVSAVYCLDDFNVSEKNEILNAHAGISAIKLPDLPAKEVIRQGGYDALRDAMQVYLGLDLVKKDSSYDVTADWLSYPLTSFDDLNKFVDHAYLDMVEFGLWRVVGHGEGVPEAILQEHFKSQEDIFYFLEEFWIEKGIRFYLKGNDFPCVRISKTCPR